MSSALETVEISGNLSVDEEAVVRGRLEEMEEAEEKEQANDRAIEDRIKVLRDTYVLVYCLVFGDGENEGKTKTNIGDERSFLCMPFKKTPRLAVIWRVFVETHVCKLRGILRSRVLRAVKYPNAK